MKNIVIVGATSAIAIACAREWAAKGARFFLVARNQERMEQVAADLTARGAASVAVYRLDINKLDDHAAMLADCADCVGHAAGSGRLSERSRRRRTRVSYQCAFADCAHHADRQSA